jgi:hypothetical protein
MLPRLRKWLALGVWAPALVLQVTGSLSAGTQPGAYLFAPTNALHRFEFELEQADLDSLRHNPRKEVRATLRHNGQAALKVGVHLKGRSGSFQDLSGKPSFTLRFDRFSPTATLDGLSKVHLNNSVEDPTYLNEAIGSALFLEAGVPTPRVTHALVTFQGRALGLYVLKEGFSKEFLGLHFADTDGNLYEHVTLPEGKAWRRESGGGPEGQLDLATLEKVCAEPDVQKRWALLAGVLDVERFLSFVALEILLVHRDGYALAVNNHWVYHDPARDQLVFLPHGMDQLLGRIDLPLRPRVSGPVARSVLELPAARTLYRTRLEMLFTNLLSNGKLVQRIQSTSAPLLAAPGLAPKLRQELQSQSNWLQQRAAARVSFVARQLQQAEQLPVRFTNGPVRLAAWRPMDVPPQGLADERPAPDGRNALHLLAGPVTSASWRCLQVLEPGRYEFLGLARTSGVKPLGFGRNQGAGLRVSGYPTSHTERQLTGDTEWTPISVTFEVKGEESEVEFVCQLRGSAGQAWFELESLRLSRLASSATP